MNSSKTSKDSRNFGVETPESTTACSTNSTEGKDSNKYEVETSEISDLSIFNTDDLQLLKKLLIDDQASNDSADFRYIIDRILQKLEEYKQDSFYVISSLKTEPESSKNAHDSKVAVSVAATKHNGKTRSIAVQCDIWDVLGAQMRNCKCCHCIGEVAIFVADAKFKKALAEKARKIATVDLLVEIFPKKTVAARKKNLSMSERQEIRRRRSQRRLNQEDLEKFREQEKSKTEPKNELVEAINMTIERHLAIRRNVAKYVETVIDFPFGTKLAYLKDAPVSLGNEEGRRAKGVLYGDIHWRVLEELPAKE